MPSLGSLEFGVGRTARTAPSQTAVACELTKPLTEDIEWSLNGGAWIVSAKKNYRYIVANGQQSSAFEQVRNSGIAAMMQALDLARTQNNLASNLLRPGDNHIVLFQSNSRSVLRLSSTFNLAASMNFSIEMRDGNGNVVQQPALPQPAWHRALRYYRLSQLASDIYEAYRSLYLAFEAIIESLYPRENNERESKWVRRCFSELHKKFNLSQFAPEGHTVPNEYLFGTLYEHTRCNLLHARAINSILPFYETDTSKIQNAYEALLQIWRQIASVELHTGGGSGVITYQGYKLWMDDIFGKSTAIAVSNDPSASSESDTAIGFSSHQISTLEDCRYIGEVNPGTVGIEAKELNVKDLPIIHKVGLTANNVLHAIAPIEGGLDLFGVDELQVFFRQRLIQESQPKVQF